MKRKLDENISVAVKTPLVALGHDADALADTLADTLANTLANTLADTLADEELSGRPDSEAFTAVQARGQALVTFDLGFAGIWAYSPGGHPGIFLLRLQGQEPTNVMAVLE